LRSSEAVSIALASGVRLIENAAAGLLGAQLHACDVPHAHERAVGQGAHDDVAELLDLLELAAHLHAVLELLRAGGGHLPDLSGGRLQVLLLHRAVDVGRRQAQA
jgi:hypothetical protein